MSANGTIASDKRKPRPSRRLFDAFAWAALAALVLATIAHLLTRPPAMPEFAAVRAAWQPSEAWLYDRDGHLLDTERVKHWVSHGAQLTDKVRALVKEASAKASARPVQFPVHPPQRIKGFNKRVNVPVNLTGALSTDRVMQSSQPTATGLCSSS